MRNTGLDEAQARIKNARRNINKFRYADNTTLMAESKEEEPGRLQFIGLQRVGHNWVIKPRLTTTIYLQAGVDLISIYSLEKVKA